MSEPERIIRGAASRLFSIATMRSASRFPRRQVLTPKCIETGEGLGTCLLQTSYGGPSGRLVIERDIHRHYASLRIAACRSVMLIGNDGHLANYAACWVLPGKAVETSRTSSIAVSAVAGVSRISGTFSGIRCATCWNAIFDAKDKRSWRLDVPTSLTCT
jgi:hypothetical protein